MRKTMVSKGQQGASRESGGGAGAATRWRQAFVRESHCSTRPHLVARSTRAAVLGDLLGAGTAGVGAADSGNQRRDARARDDAGRCSWAGPQRREPECVSGLY